MQETTSYHQELVNRISPIIEKLFKTNSLYLVKLKKPEITESLVQLFGKFTPEEMKSISDEELTRRIDKILVIKAVSGTLNDLTPEQIKIFDESVEGK
ncbi:MAG: hypothetical protein QNJ47_22890 [Nostocaceae cyanobacterium]|nr:hypothetical protein [Nostocaceae cyanobacterium]